jgi:alkylation response protein AidB-like acyl-CoA dehydrogenase
MLPEPKGKRMTVSLTDALVDLNHPVKRAVTVWAHEHLSDSRLGERDAASEFWTEGWKRCAQYGIQGLMIDERFGGQGADLATTLLTLEGLGLGCEDNGLVFALCAQMWTIQAAIARFGSPEQQQRWLPGMCDGSILGSFCMTEPNTGSDAFALSTSAEISDGGITINGEKAYVTLGPVADVFLVFVNSNPAAGKWGLSAVLVEADRPGVEVLEGQPKMGVRTTPFCNVRFNNCTVPTSNLLGRLGSGGSIFGAVLDDERAFMFIGQLGATERVLQRSIDRAKTRHQFGRPIGDFQAVSHRIADMRLEHETARLLLYKAAILKDCGSANTLVAALTKLHLSEMSVRTSIDAVKIHGASGFLTATEIERELRDAVGGLVYSGTSDIQRNIVARLLGLGSH